MTTGTKEHEYVLGRDYLSSARLNLQHYLWVEELGYHVHPSIPLKPGAKVADVATGTGVWMIDLAHRHPDVSFHGFDVDLAQAPPPEWLPANAKLDVMDLLKPISDEFAGQFDVVHTRLLMCVISENPAPILENLMKLLKPGGYLQWGEMDHPTHRFEKSKPEHSIEWLQQAGEFPSTLRTEDTRMDARWVSQLAEYYKKGGLEVVADEHKYRGSSHLAFYCDPAFMVWEEWRSKMAPKDAAKYGEILTNAKKEVQDAKRGVSINMEIRTVVGRKPE
ncbi:S-adenosyl-L-methionine-dependent methyltransferase [Stachybotrys elegans]|uniref:S-adenosyl-L-methionine-dependent methyltransferase n=1 Tax=Stachybotrys elegans TaxID=80388 RepID=A0A8K0SLB7_9HYPO|nr:S-adenosyl-L-methionine-dependent methyltransferase [Stachybotrys elegans]